jgi:KDO2-lipid IV(A) lauroyltransferase
LNKKDTINSFFVLVKYILSYTAVRFLAGLMRILPFPAMSLMANGVAIFLHRVVQYRRRTALLNLKRCFPELTQRAIQRMLPSVYLNLTDVFLETVKAFSKTPEKILTHIELPPQAALDLYHDHFRGAIIVTAHVANWEWCGYTLPAVLRNPGMVAYRPLKNPYVEKIVRNHRELSGMKVIPMREIVKHVARGSADNHFVLLIADQSPDPKGAHWLDFFGVKTAFFKGPSTLAYRYDLPIFFVHLERTQRHHYRMHLEPLCLEPRLQNPEEMTRAYAQNLEEYIRSAPSNWLWTHRRWKHKPPADA